jgi:hypothetical protein
MFYVSVTTEYSQNNIHHDSLNVHLLKKPRSAAAAPLHFPPVCPFPPPLPPPLPLLLPAPELVPVPAELEFEADVELEV